MRGGSSSVVEKCIVGVSEKRIIFERVRLNTRCASKYGDADGCGCGSRDGCDGCGCDDRDVPGCDGGGRNGCDGNGSDGCDSNGCNVPPVTVAAVTDVTLPAVHEHYEICRPAQGRLVRFGQIDMEGLHRPPCARRRPPRCPSTYSLSLQAATTRLQPTS